MQLLSLLVLTLAVLLCQPPGLSNVTVLAGLLGFAWFV